MAPAGTGSDAPSSDANAPVVTEVSLKVKEHSVYGSGTKVRVEWICESSNDKERTLIVAAPVGTIDCEGMSWKSREEMAPTEFGFIVQLDTLLEKLKRGAMDAELAQIQLKDRTEILYTDVRVTIHEVGDAWVHGEVSAGRWDTSLRGEFKARICKGE